MREFGTPGDDEPLQGEIPLPDDLIEASKEDGKRPTFKAFDEYTLEKCGSEEEAKKNIRAFMVKLVEAVMKKPFRDVDKFSPEAAKAFERVKHEVGQVLYTKREPNDPLWNGVLKDLESVWNAQGLLY